MVLFVILGFYLFSFQFRLCCSSGERSLQLIVYSPSLINWLLINYYVIKRPYKVLASLFKIENKKKMLKVFSSNNSLKIGKAMVFVIIMWFCLSYAIADKEYKQ